MVCLAGNGDERTAHGVTPAETGCIKLLHYADMILHDADQVEIQTVDYAILNKCVLAVSDS